MKKLMLAAAVILGTVTMSFAQSTDNTAVTLNATVIQGLVLTVSGTLSFGTIVAGTTPAALSAQTNGSAPMFTTTGNGSSVITVTYPATSTLISGANTLTFTPSVYGAAVSTAQATSASVANSATVTLSGTTGSAGNYYFWLGGNLGTLPSAQAPGSYAGTFTLTVTYF